MALILFHIWRPYHRGLGQQRKLCLIKQIDQFSLITEFLELWFPGSPGTTLQYWLSPPDGFTTSDTRDKECEDLTLMFWWTDVSKECLPVFLMCHTVYSTYSLYIWFTSILSYKAWIFHEFSFEHWNSPVSSVCFCVSEWTWTFFILTLKLMAVTLVTLHVWFLFIKNRIHLGSLCIYLHAVKPFGRTDQLEVLNTFTHVLELLLFNK